MNKEKKMNKPTCETCIYQEGGLCRVNPPITSADGYIGFWPSLSTMMDWCGQHSDFHEWEDFKGRQEKEEEEDE